MNLLGYKMKQIYALQKVMFWHFEGRCLKKCLEARPQTPFYCTIFVHSHVCEHARVSPAFIGLDYALQSVVISKTFNKRGSKHNHVQRLGVAQL